MKTLLYVLTLTNYAGTTLTLRIDRTITLLNRDEAAQRLKTSLTDDIKLVGYQTVNRLTNTGKTEWNQRTGAPCLWMLDMFVPLKARYPIS